MLSKTMSDRVSLFAFWFIIIEVPVIWLGQPWKWPVSPTGARQAAERANTYIADLDSKLAYIRADFAASSSEMSERATVAVLESGVTVNAIAEAGNGDGAATLERDVNADVAAIAETSERAAGDVFERDGSADAATSVDENAASDTFENDESANVTTEASEELNPAVACYEEMERAFSQLKKDIDKRRGTDVFSQRVFLNGKETLLQTIRARRAGRSVGKALSLIAKNLADLRRDDEERASVRKHIMDCISETPEAHTPAAYIAEARTQLEKAAAPVTAFGMAVYYSCFALLWICLLLVPLAVTYVCLRFFARSRSM